MAYTTLADIQRTIPQVKIDQKSRPTDTEVESMIGQVEAELNVIVSSVGFVVPVTGTSSIAILRGMVASEVASRVLITQFAGIRNPDDLGADRFHNAYAEKIRALVDPNNPFTLPDATIQDIAQKLTAGVSSIFTGYQSDEDRVITRETVF